jgi:predicted MFS family arabinose efflux permease
VLLAADPHTGLPGGVAVGGLLAATLSVPHLLGPWVARPLDRARDPRLVLAAAFTVYGCALGAAGLFAGRAPVAVVAACTLVAGACGPLLTGGLSSQVAALVGAGERRQRRGQGWDAASYGIGGTAGPALVALLAATTGPRTTVLVLAAAPVLAAAIALLIPRLLGPGVAPDEVFTVRQGLVNIAVDGRLRRVAVATMMTALTLGAMSVFSVLLGQELTGRPRTGALLGAAFGIGNLLGSLAVTAFPLRGEPERLTVRHVVLMAVAFGLCGLAPTYPVALLAFALAGASNAPFVTATLAARSQYAPPQARAQVFVAVAGLKVAASSAGTAVAGLCAGVGARALLGGCALVTLLAAATAVADRRLSGPAPAPAEPEQTQAGTAHTRR